LPPATRLFSDDKVAAKKVVAGAGLVSLGYQK